MKGVRPKQKHNLEVCVMACAVGRKQSEQLLMRFMRSVPGLTVEQLNKALLQHSKKNKCYVAEESNVPNVHEGCAPQAEAQHAQSPRAGMCGRGTNDLSNYL